MLERDIETRLMGRQFLGKVIRVQLTGEARNLRLSYEVDRTAIETLSRDWLGRQVLITDRHDWSTAEIIRAYRGQADVEAVFEHIKDPVHVMLRPQYHWTDQKLHVHVFTCVMGYLLGRLLFLKAQRALGYAHSMERLLDTLAQVRQLRVARCAGKKGLRVTTQFEDMDADTAKLARELGVVR